MRAVVVTFVALASLFGMITWWALEAGGVAIVETRTPDGTVRSTHVWYVERDGEPWLEAGTPENAWFEDLEHDPMLMFSTDGQPVRYVAHPLAEPAAHRHIRSLMREKYGLRDRWVNLIVDTSRSIAVRLEPADDVIGNAGRHAGELR